MFFFFFKQKTAYEMRISDWSSDVCSSDLRGARRHDAGDRGRNGPAGGRGRRSLVPEGRADDAAALSRPRECASRRGGGRIADEPLLRCRGQGGLARHGRARLDGRGGEGADGGGGGIGSGRLAMAPPPFRPPPLDQQGVGDEQSGSV